MGNQKEGQGGTPNSEGWGVGYERKGGKGSVIKDA